MINTSIEFQQALDQNSKCAVKADIQLNNGTQLQVDESKIVLGGTKIDDGVSSSGKFEIGSAITNKLTLSLNNMDDQFSDYDFTDAIITIWVGKHLSPTKNEWLKKGVFNSEDPTATPSILNLECLDNMSKFDKAYDKGISFPATLQVIVQYCCDRCGVILANKQFPNYAYTVSKNPFDANNNITYRALLSYCALITGCYVRCNADGRLEFKWYDVGAFNNLTDGGIFDRTEETSYQTGASLDGGNFTDYESGDTADGGSFMEVWPYHHIFSFNSLSVSTEDVVITGIRVKASDAVDSEGKKIEGETYLSGVEGYVLSVTGNPLIEYGQARAVAEYLGTRVVGMRFRPLQASCLGNPSWEAGDAAIVTDRKGNSYYTYLTNITYSTGSYARISCDAEPAARHSAEKYSAMNQIVSDIKRDNQQQINSYTEYVTQLGNLAISAMGYYETTQTQGESTIRFMHDKPQLSGSTLIYRQTSNGVFSWSVDGGRTYTSGVPSRSANVVMSILAALKVSLNWLSGGTLILGGSNNTNGVLVVQDASGAEKVRLDQTGISSERLDALETRVTTLESELEALKNGN